MNGHIVRLVVCYIMSMVLQLKMALKLVPLVTNVVGIVPTGNTNETVHQLV